MKWRWYISAAAVRQWLAICRVTAGDDSPEWFAAERELGALSLRARLSEPASRRERGASLIYRGYSLVRDEVARVECTVVVTPRPEGKLPQLVRVRRKG